MFYLVHSLIMPIFASENKTITHLNTGGNGKQRRKIMKTTANNVSEIKSFAKGETYTISVDDYNEAMRQANKRTRKDQGAVHYREPLHLHNHFPIPQVRVSLLHRGLDAILRHDRCKGHPRAFLLRPQLVRSRS